MIKLIFVLVLILHCGTTIQFSLSNRCDSLCQNDERCKSGQCILTYCSETVSCYQFCLLCNQNLQCYKTGDHCIYGNKTCKIYHNAIIYLSLISTVLIKITLF